VTKIFQIFCGYYTYAFFDKLHSLRSGLCRKAALPNRWVAIVC